MNIEKAPILTNEQVPELLKQKHPHMFNGNDEVWCRETIELLIHRLNDYHTQLLLEFMINLCHEHYSKIIKELKESLDIAYFKGVEDGKEQARKEVAREIINKAERELYPSNTFSVGTRIEYFIKEVKSKYITQP